MSEKKKGHGNRKHLQILLAPNRGQLFLDHMKSLDEKPTAKIRDMVYDYLKKVIPKDVYNEAKRKDDLDWQQTVQNRLKGRALSLASCQNIKGAVQE